MARGHVAHAQAAQAVIAEGQVKAHPGQRFDTGLKFDKGAQAGSAKVEFTSKFECAVQVDAVFNLEVLHVRDRHAERIVNGFLKAANAGLVAHADDVEPE